MRSNRALLFGGIGLFILAVGLASLLLLMQLYQQATARAVLTTRNLAKSIEQTVDGLIDTIDVTLLSSAKAIGAQISAGHADAKLIQDLLEAQKKYIAFNVHFRATDAAGNVIYGGKAGAPVANIADREYFQKLKTDREAGLIFEKPSQGVIVAPWTISFARRIATPDGRFAGVVLVAVPIDEISQMLAKIDIGTGNSISIRSSDLSVITRIPLASLANFPVGETRASQAFYDAVRGNPIEGSYRSGATGVDGIDRLYSYYRSTKYGFLVIVGADSRNVFSEWRRFAWNFGAQAALLAVALLAFSLLVHRAWRRQEDSLERLSEAQRIANLGSYAFDLRTGKWESSSIFDRIFGIDASFPRDAEHWQALVAPEFKQVRRQLLQGVHRQGGNFDLEYQIVRPLDGQKRWIRSMGKATTDLDGTPAILIGAILDITETKRYESELRIAATAFESQAAMLITDVDSVILRVNRAFMENTGYTAEELIGKKPNLLRSGRHGKEFYQAMWTSIRETGGWQGEIWDRRKDGQEYQKWLTISAVRDAEGRVSNYIGVQYDITERKRAEEKIRELAFFDQLTGLPNRMLLLDRLKQAIASGARAGKHGALILIDLDNFKTLNDTRGHDMGDHLLKQVAQRLGACVRNCDTVARLGGDEFVVLLVGLSAELREAARQTESIGDKIRRSLHQPYDLPDTTYHCTASLGASLFVGSATEVESLLKQSDLAMYRAKEGGRDALRFFDPAMEAEVTKRAALERDLREAIAAGQMTLHYQAQVEDERLVGAEALVRWRHPVHGMVSPAEFIPLAEETGLILPLGHQVLVQACTQLARWAEHAETRHLSLAVNVSAQQFRASEFVAQVLEVVSATGANPKRLKIELTESSLAENVQEIVEKMAALKKHGIGFSLDDFGTGYSSLAYLKRFPLNQLKIDQSFVRDVLDDANDASIAKTIIALASNLGLDVIAEGVETAAQRDFLKTAGCSIYQGYYFSKPLPAADFMRFASDFGVASA